MDISTAQAPAAKSAARTAARSRESRMLGPFIETADGTHLFYKEWGAGKPILFVHSWSVNSDMWDYQMVELVDRGCRCIAYDRRGHGRSSQPGRGYDFDTLADDTRCPRDAAQLAFEPRRLRSLRPYAANPCRLRQSLHEKANYSWNQVTNEVELDQWRLNQCRTLDWPSSRPRSQRRVEPTPS